MSNILDIILAEVQQLRTELADLRGKLASVEPTEQDRYVGTKEAAAVLGRKTDWVRDNLHRIPHSRPDGGQLQFSILELRAWAEERFTQGRARTTAKAAARAMAGTPKNRLRKAG